MRREIRMASTINGISRRERCVKTIESRASCVMSAATKTGGISAFWTGTRESSVFNGTKIARSIHEPQWSSSCVVPAIIDSTCSKSIACTSVHRPLVETSNAMCPSVPIHRTWLDSGIGIMEKYMSSQIKGTARLIFSAKINSILL